MLLYHSICGKINAYTCKANGLWGTEEMSKTNSPRPSQQLHGGIFARSIPFPFSLRVGGAIAIGVTGMQCQQREG